NASVIGVSLSDLSKWRISDSYFDKHANAIYVYLQQTYKGIDIDRAVSVLAFRDEKFITGNLDTIQDFRAVNKDTRTGIDAKTALIKAAQAVNLTVRSAIYPLKTVAETNTYQFDKLGISMADIPVKLIWVRTDENQNNFKLVWQVSILTQINNAFWNVNVDAATGSIQKRQNLTVYEQMSKPIAAPHKIFVFEDDQEKFAHAPQINNSVQDLKSINSTKLNVIANPYESIFYTNPGTEVDPWTRNHDQNANTLKWNNDGTSDFKITRGNNVLVQTDLDSNNATAGYSPQSSTNPPDLNFLFTFNPDVDPLEDPSFGEVNLFYWTNLMHDMSYQYGFDEPSGNFQKNNLSRGGDANDFVNVDAQDGGGAGWHINNANFSTPADGSSPRMQMYLWSPSLLKLFVVNSPAGFKGGKPAIESAVSINNKIAVKGPITSNVVIWQDALHPDSSTGCGSAANAAQIAGHIAYIDRGSCNFTVKFLSAQSAGATAIIVGNVAPDDPRYPGDNTGNTLVTMSGTENTIKIPGVFIEYDTAAKLKSYGSGNVNATLQASPKLDGAVDNGVHTHEYTHGISNRLVGGRLNVNCLSNSEQMGEGWSDWFAIMMTSNWGTASAGGDHIKTIGNYAAGLDTNFTGIRYYPYSTNFNYDPWTYDSLAKLPTAGDPHTVGEIWCSMLWELTWELVKDYGIGINIFDASETGGNNTALSLVIEGMKQTKCSPGFVDARDGILKADTLLYGGKYSKEIWMAFARRGLGYSANQGKATDTKDGTAAYDVPSVLPVTWGKFTAVKQVTTALLSWSTVQEFNSDKFVVERSSDGRTFNAIGQVKAAGNSSTERSYQFTDQFPVKGNNVYRIKQMDMEGRANLSDLRSLNFSDLRPYITISPNPATNKVTINIPGNDQNVTMRLLSNTGQLIRNLIMTGETLTVDVSMLASGVYNISLDGNGYSTKYKLVIQ
ncbi:MAG TPA: M36 family metallopeptidase, partial [Parafilimonas sp.]|nr:M36 family metallopeptidase [Parafilimonas sp.]